MKAKLIFDMNEPDDELALNRSLKATSMAIVLFEIQYNLKKKCFCDVESHDPDDGKLDEIELVFQKIMELFEEHNINTDDLIR